MCIKKSLLILAIFIYSSSCCYWIDGIQDHYDFEYYLTEINDEGFPVSRKEITGIRNGVAGYSDVAVSPYHSDNRDFLISIFSMHKDPKERFKYVSDYIGDIYNHIFIVDSKNNDCNGELLHTLRVDDLCGPYRSDDAKSWAVSTGTDDFYQAHLYMDYYSNNYYQSLYSLSSEEGYYSDKINWVPGIIFDSLGNLFMIQNLDVADDSPDPIYIDKFFLYSKYPGKDSTSSEWISGTHYPSGDICWILGIDENTLVVLDDSWQVLHLDLNLMNAELKGRGDFFNSAEELQDFMNSTYISYDYDLKNIVAVKNFQDKSEVFFFDTSLNLMKKLIIVFDKNKPEYIRYISSLDNKTVIMEVR